METTADRIRALRREWKLTQQQLGSLCGGLSKQAVYQWEKGETMPDWGALHALQRQRGINPRWVLYAEPPKLLQSNGSQPAPDLTPRQRVLLDLFEGLTAAQQEALIRELEEKKSLNEALLAELLARRPSGTGEP